MRSDTATRVIGLALSLSYSAFIVWAYAHQPRTLVEVRGGVASSLGVYRIDETAFADGLRFFREEKYPEARLAFERADPAHRDATTQFYIGYSFYRQGWGRLYNDDALLRNGLSAVDRAITSAPGGRVAVDDSNLTLRTSDELKAEIERELTHDLSDLNPLRVVRERK
jgi:hypothetical protein